MSRLYCPSQSFTISKYSGSLRIGLSPPLPLESESCILPTWASAYDKGSDFLVIISDCLPNSSIQSVKDNIGVGVCPPMCMCVCEGCVHMFDACAFVSMRQGGG